MQTVERKQYQTRGLPTEYRAQDGDGKKYIEGYFAVFGAVYELWPGATESIAPTAFEGALEDDIRALVDHRTELVLGRNKAGTLDLRVDERGLWGRVEINEADADAMNIYARVQRGDVDQCSFGFEILDEDTDYRDDGSVHWTIRRVKLYEVSVCTFPAYKETSVSARQRDYNDIKKRQLESWRLNNLRRLKRDA